MQAPLSNTASGDHLFCSFPPLNHPEAPPTLFAAPDIKSLAVMGRTSATYVTVADGIGLAHDAGNLLGAIRLYCDLLALPGVLRGEHRHYAEELRRLTARSGSLIGRLLRPDTPAVPLAERPEDETSREAERMCLADAVMACRGMLEPVVGEGALLIAVEAGARGEIDVPQETLERILLNLVKNAAEARSVDAVEHERGAIAVRVRAERGWGPARVQALVLSVEDHGSGMDEGSLQAALAGLSRLGCDGGASERGIGLRVVRELTARTGGELRMRSRLGQGTTVEIVWALVPEDRAGSG